MVWSDTSCGDYSEDQCLMQRIRVSDSDKGAQRMDAISRMNLL
jgi:hypothetical protein